MIKDHCTAWFEGGPFGYWGDCCRVHDTEYGEGEVSRVVSDFRLAKCVWRTRHPIISVLMFIGVRIGGYFRYNHERHYRLMKEVYYNRANTKGGETTLTKRRPQPKKVKIECPSCESRWLRRNQKSQNYICRGCATVFRVDSAGRRFIVGQ